MKWLLCGGLKRRIAYFQGAFVWFAWLYAHRLGLLAEPQRSIIIQYRYMAISIKEIDLHTFVHAHKNTYNAYMLCARI